MSNVTCARKGSKVIVKSPYWTVIHDLKAGGCWSSITFAKGSGKNLLADPVTSRLRFFQIVPGQMYSNYIEFLECGEKSPDVRVQTNDTGDPVVVAEGRYTSLSRPSPGGRGDEKTSETLPVRYRRTWTYRDWGLVDSTLEILPERELREVVEVCAAKIDFRPGLTHHYVREHPACGSHSDLLGLGEWRTLQRGKSAYSQRYTPIHMVWFEKDVEGIDFCPSSDLDAWDASLCGLPGHGLYFTHTDADGATHAEIDPYCMAFRRIPVTLKTSGYRFRHYWGLPFVKRREEVSTPYFHSSTNSDWASDEQLAELASAGVKLLRFHCDYLQDRPFWHDGMYPPFDEAGMRELRRVVDTCHRLGMKIVPYVSLKELHPNAPEHAAHADAWTQRPSTHAREIHTHIHGGEFGQVMCMESDWLAFRRKATDIMLDDVPWDGLYFDWCCPHACTHQGHGPKGAYHTDTDGYFDWMFYARSRVGKDGVLLLHLSGLPYIVAENMADETLIYEDVGGEPPRPGEFPPQCDFFPIAPRNLVLGSSDLVKARQFIMGGMLQGYPPFTSTIRRPFARWMLDEVKPFGREDLTQYRFRRASDGPVETGREAVFASLWYRKGRALIYAGNFSDKSAKSRLRFDPSLLGKNAARGKITVTKLAGTQGKDASSTVSAAALKRDGIACTLKPWGSALYRIET